MALRFIAPAVAALLAAVAAAVYGPTTEFPFVRYDDDIRLLANEPVRAGLSGDGLYWAFTATWDANWSPITWLSHMLDFTLFAGDAGGHHATNVLLHALNAALLFALLRAASGSLWRAAAVALLFALHPIHVETVAWVSERKGLLSSTFAFASLWCYAIDLHRAAPRYRTLSLAFLGLGLMAKPMLVSVPLLLLLLERLSPGAAQPVPLRQRLVAIWPWLAMSAVSIAITLYAQVQSGALEGVGALPLHLRVANALVASALYLWKLVWPAQLAAFYPHAYLPGGTPWSALQIAGAALFWSAAIALAWRSGHRGLRVGLAWYAIALLPVAGLVQVGGQGLADRYLYLPAVGVYVAVVWCAADAVRARGRTLHWAAGACAAVAVAALALAGQRQIQVWRSSETLFRHAVEVTEANFSMHYHLAEVLAERGDIEGSIDHYRTAIAIHPGMALAHYDLANLLTSEERFEEALVHYRGAVEGAPDLQSARDSLGRILLRLGDLDGAIAHYREEAHRQPGALPIQTTLAQLLRMTGRLREAIDAYEAAARIDPNGERWRREAQTLRARLLSESGPPRDAEPPGTGP